MNRTRLFVIASLVTLTAGLGAGFAAYLGGRGIGALSGSVPGELSLLPANSALLAYVDLRHIMTSELRRQLQPMLGNHSEAQRRFQEQTGIDVERDIDRVLIAVVPERRDTGEHGDAVVLARGRFDRVKIEAHMRDQGAQVEEYKGVRLIVGDPGSAPKMAALGFLEPDLIVVGSGALVRATVDLRDGGASIATNAEIMALLPELESSHAWAAGRFDALPERNSFPSGVVDRLPSLNLFTASARIDGGLQGRLRVEARDEQGATKLRDVARGFLALARMQATARPELQAALDALQLGGTGTSVTLAFDLPPSALSALGSLTRPASTSAPQ